MTNKEAYGLQVGKVVLNVNNLSDMTDYYQNVIGLSVLKQNEESTILGIKENNKILVELEQVPLPEKKKQTTGLYHLALLLPSRADLGSFLYHLMSSQSPLIGASDHGYSEALYLEDPEGNGIEVYADKPTYLWNIHDNGMVVGTTLPLNLEDVIQCKRYPFKKMPTGTILGHVHLTVNDLNSTAEFYQHIMGLSLKADYPGQAKFFSVGEYHHHLGVNVWRGTNLSAPEENQLGLSYYTWEASIAEDFDKLLSHLQEHKIDYSNDEGTLSFKDNSGITVQVVVV